MLSREEAKEKLGKRIERCSGCYGAFYLRDMWLGPEATYYCEDCKTDEMFHFDQFTEKLDLENLPTMQDGEEEKTQCQNPFTHQN